MNFDACGMSHFICPHPWNKGEALADGKQIALNHLTCGVVIAFADVIFINFCIETHGN